MVRKFLAVLLILLISSTAYGQAGYQPKARNIITDTTNFNVNLSTADTNVQKALDTLDELVGGGGGGFSSLSIEENDVLISSPTASIDFRDGFDVTESPAGEANIVVDPDEVITAGTNIDWSGHILNVDLATGTITQGYDLDLDDLADGTLSASKVAGVKDADYGDVTVSAGTWGVEDKFLRNYEDDSTSYKLTVSSFSVTNQTTLNSSLSGLAKLTSGVVSAITDSSSNWNTAYTHSQNNNQAHTDYLKNDADDTTNYKITMSSSTVTNNATVGSLSSSGQVTSNNRKVIDTIELDAYVIVGSTTTIGTTPFRISAYRDYAITITTMTAKAFGGTNCIGMIEQRLRSADGSSGTDIWTGDITITTAGYIGGTVADFTVPANYALWFVPTSWSGAVTGLSFDGAGTKD